MQQPPVRKRLTPAQRIILAASQQYRCAMCDALLPSAWEVDHRVPLYDGGSNDWSNLHVICPVCHALKTQREAIQREEKKKFHSSSPYFAAAFATNAENAVLHAPPFVLRRRCKAPAIHISYADP